MMIYYFLPAIVWIGIITSYQDIKSGKIRNNWVIFSLCFAAAMNAMLFAAGIIGSRGIGILLANIALSAVFAFALWNFNFWSAGDGKLFIAFAALLPVGYYSSPLVGYFPSLNVFINTVVPFFAYIIVRKIFCVPLKTAKKSFYEGVKNFPALFAALFSVRWVAGIINDSLFDFHSAVSFFLLHAATYYLINLAITRALQKFRGKAVRPVHVYLALILARLFMDPSGVLSLEAVYSVLLVTIAYSLIFRSLQRAVYECSYKKKRVSKLQKGDVIFRAEKKQAKQALKKGSLLDFMECAPEGLSEKEIRKIKKLEKSKKIKLRTVAVAETVAFAPALFIGVIITLVFGNIGNFIYLAIYLFKLAWGLF